MAAQQLIKTSMSLPENSVETVRELADEAGTSMAEIIRKAIAIQKLLRDTTKRGGKILLRDKDDKTSELILL
jgi:hypothetical protein